MYDVYPFTYGLDLQAIFLHLCVGRIHKVGSFLFLMLSATDKLQKFLRVQGHFARKIRKKVSFLFFIRISFPRQKPKNDILKNAKFYGVWKDKSDTAFYNCDSFHKKERHENSEIRTLEKGQFQDVYEAKVAIMSAEKCQQLAE